MWWDWREIPGLSSPQIQDIFLGGSWGAAFHDRPELAIIHSSVLDVGAVVKAIHSSNTHRRDGMLPFLTSTCQKLPETSVIYVSFVYMIQVTFEP
ncbi:hypothetical protein FQN60_014821 [Etheostoma spectabile]|uniref:Uncharacterized protein n=1 Tax=Etheostoma spectabile TaxID=54343 RepID=A0A5J5CS75_9PERO|nr:hypothetical protein FQN60_014821 [Etheostoma spectabile]